MLMIPMATKSLINDGLEGAASALGAAPTLAGLGAVRSFAKYTASKATGGAKNALSYSVRPARNLIERGVDKAKDRLDGKVNIRRPLSRLNRKFSELGMNEKQKIKRRSKINKKVNQRKESGRVPTGKQRSKRSEKK